VLYTAGKTVPVFTHRGSRIVFNTRCNIAMVGNTDIYIYIIGIPDRVRLAGYYDGRLRNHTAAFGAVSQGFEESVEAGVKPQCG
jgi:hypothetical protein